MYVWRNQNRRDRRHHALTNPFTSPTAIDVQGYKAWYHGRQLKDEKCRLDQERQYVEGYTARRIKSFEDFLNTAYGKKELRLVAANLARIQAAEKRRQMREKRRKNIEFATTQLAATTMKLGATTMKPWLTSAASIASGESGGTRMSAESKAVGAGLSESGSMEKEGGGQVGGGKGGSPLQGSKVSIMARLFGRRQVKGGSVSDDSTSLEEEDEGKGKKKRPDTWIMTTMAPWLGASKSGTMDHTFFKTEWAVDIDRQEAQKVFNLFDGDGTGSIDKEELSDLMEQLCIPLTDKELEDLMQELDKDKSDTIDFEEFFDWYQNTAQQQKDKRMLKSAGLQVNKFLRAIRGLTLETEARHIMVAHEEHQARDYAQRAFRACRPPSHACTECQEVCMTQKDLDVHVADDWLHQDWRAKKEATCVRFKCVIDVLEGPTGRRFKCLRAQFDSILHTPPVEPNMQPLAARPMISDPDSRRLKQLVNGMCVETLSVYFSKRAPFANAYPLRHRQPVKPQDLPQSLTNLALRLLHQDRSMFNTHQRDVLGLEQSPRATDDPFASSTKNLGRTTMTNLGKSTANLGKTTNLLKHLLQLKSTDPEFSTKVQGRHDSCVEVEFRWKTGTQAFLLGSFGEWSEEIMEFEFDTQEHSLVRRLSVGVHLYCFRVNGRLKIDTTKPTVGSGAHRRNVLTVWEPLEQEGPLPYEAISVMDLQYQNIGDYGVWFLFSLLELIRPLVLTMDLSFNGISGHGIAGAAPILRHLAHLRSLKLNSNGIGYEGAKTEEVYCKTMDDMLFLLCLCMRGCQALGAAFEQNISLATLEIANNPLGDDGVEAISKGLQGNGNLTHLNVDNTILGDDGLAALCDMLLHNAALRSITMRYNRFTPKAVSSRLQPSLLRNGTITSLNLAHNHIGPEGTTALAQVLAVSDSLRSLDLSVCQVCGKNRVVKQGIFYLAESLTKNKSLTSLSLRTNGINNFGATQLALAFTVNRTLVILDLHDNPLLNEWMVPDHLLYTETHTEGIPSITTSIDRNRQHQQRMKEEEAIRQREEELRKEEELRRKREEEERERKNNKKRKRRLQVAQQQVDESQQQQASPPRSPKAVLFDEDEILCPQIKVQGEWQTDRRWLSKEEVDRLRRGDLQAAEDTRQEAEDKFVNAAVHEAVEKARAHMQKTAAGARHLTFVMRGLKLIAEGKGVPSTDDLLMGTSTAAVKGGVSARRASPRKAKKKKAKPTTKKRGDGPAGDDEEDEEEGGEDEEDDAETLHIFRIFQAYDANCSNSIDATEFEYMCKDLCLPLSHEEIGAVMKTLDTDGSGEISFEEFLQWFKEMGRKTQGERRLQTTFLRVGNILKNTNLLLQRSEAAKLILLYHERKARDKSVAEFRRANPPGYVCSRCNKAFAYDEPGRGLSKHMADTSVHTEMERQAKLTEPRLTVVDHSLEAVEREMNLQWPKLFVFTKHVPKSQPFPVLDRPDDKTGRTIGGLEHDATIKGLEYHQRGQWLQIDYKGCEQAYVRRRAGLTYYVAPLVKGKKRYRPPVPPADAEKAKKKANKRKGKGWWCARCFSSRRLAIASSRLLSTWPIKVGQIDFFTASAKYYRTGPGLPSNVQLKVRVQPDISARVLGYLTNTMIIKVVGRSGDWVMVEYKTAGHAWMLARNRAGRQLLVPETNTFALNQAMHAAESPYDCKVDLVEEEPLSTGRSRDSDTDSIIDLLEATMLHGQKI